MFEANMHEVKSPDRMEWTHFGFVPCGRAVAGAAPTIQSACRAKDGSESRSATREGPEGCLCFHAVGFLAHVDDSEASAEKVPMLLFSFVFFGGSIENLGKLPSLMMRLSVVIQNAPEEPADLAGLCSPHATKASLLCHFWAPAAGVVCGGGRAPASICQSVMQPSSLAPPKTLVGSICHWTCSHRRHAVEVVDPGLHSTETSREKGDLMTKAT